MLDLHTAETESPIALQWSPNGGDWFFGGEILTRQWWWP